MGKALIIGCGGVASVAIHKCCQNSEVFEEICIASRTVSKCDALKEKLQGTTKTKITTAQVDADNVEELVALIRKVQPDVADHGDEFQLREALFEFEPQVVHRGFCIVEQDQFLDSERCQLAAQFRADRTGGSGDHDGFFPEIGDDFVQ